MILLIPAIIYISTSCNVQHHHSGLIELFEVHQNDNVLPAKSLELSYSFDGKDVPIHFPL